MASKRRNEDSEDESDDEEFVPSKKTLLPSKKAKEDDSSDDESVDEEEDSGASDDDKKDGVVDIGEEEEVDSEEEAEVGGDKDVEGDDDLEAQLKEKPIKVNPTWQFEVKDLVKAIKEVRKGASASTASKMFGISAGTIQKFAADYPLRKKKKVVALEVEVDAEDKE